MGRDDVITVSGAAGALGVSAQQVRRLVATGDLVRVARGVIDRASVDQYVARHRGGRKRVWAEHTAWGSVALLSGDRAPWLGSTQESRLRAAIRGLTSADDLLVRARARAAVRTYEAHPAVLGRVAAALVVPEASTIGLGVATGTVDGYVAADRLDDLTNHFGLAPATDGAVTIRSTAVDFTIVEGLAASPVLAALDAATTLDPRARGVGARALEEALTRFRI